MKKDMPDWVFRSPQFFYAAAILIFAGYFVIGMIELQGVAWQQVDSDASRLGAFRVLLDAFNPAVYMFGTGVWLQVMIILWSRVIGKLEDEGE